MSSTVVLEPIVKALPDPRARVTGVVYLSYFLAAILAQLLLGRNFVGYGTAINLVATGCYIALTLLFYGMFEPVDRTLSSLAALCSLAGCIVMSLGFFPRTTLPFSPMLFFGPYCLLIGYLIFRSTFLPHILGVLMACAGVGWLAYLSPGVAHSLNLYIKILGIFAEAALMLWLIIMGVNITQWKSRRRLHSILRTRKERKDEHCSND